MTVAFQTAQILPAFPDFAAFDYEVALQGSTWKFEYVWREGLNSWYLSIFDTDGNPLIYGRRLSPNCQLVESRLDFPGKLVCIGDDSHRDNLGTDLLVMFYILE